MNIAPVTVDLLQDKPTWAGGPIQDPKDVVS